MLNALVINAMLAAPMTPCKARRPSWCKSGVVQKNAAGIAANGTVTMRFQATSVSAESLSDMRFNISCTSA